MGRGGGGAVYIIYGGKGRKEEKGNGALCSEAPDGA